MDEGSDSDTNKVSDRFAKLQHLTDHPVEEDLLAGGAHARTAKALVDTIVNEEGGGKAIGLEGTWGSGKSSVVEIARQQLENRKTRRYPFMFLRLTFGLTRGTR